MAETKTTFTPGPWLVDPRFPDTIRAADGTTLFVGTTDNARKFENARLIAAAPDLYAAASEIIRLHDTYTGEPRDDDAISLAMADLRAALARANGEG